METLSTVLKRNLLLSVYISTLPPSFVHPHFLFAKKKWQMIKWLKKAQTNINRRKVFLNKKRKTFVPILFFCWIFLGFVVVIVFNLIVLLCFSSLVWIARVQIYILISISFPFNTSFFSVHFLVQHFLGRINLMLLNNHRLQQ